MAEENVQENKPAPPQGVRLSNAVPREECTACDLDTEDHTIGDLFSYKVCVKDYRAMKASEDKPADPPQQDKPIVLTKIVVTLKDSKAIIGVQAEECDPYTETADLSIGRRDITDVIPGVINNALVQWNNAKKYPKFTGQLPSQVKPPPPPPRAATPSSPKTVNAPKSGKPVEPARLKQGSMF